VIVDDAVRFGEAASLPSVVEGATCTVRCSVACESGTCGERDNPLLLLRGLTNISSCADWSDVIVRGIKVADLRNSRETSFSLDDSVSLPCRCTDIRYV